MRRLSILLLSLIAVAAAHSQSFLPDPSLKVTVPLPAVAIRANTGGFPSLKADIQKSKLLLLGESHWMSEHHAALTSLVLYANTVDHFPLLVMELPLSATAGINAWLRAKDTTESVRIFPTIAAFFGSKEKRALLDSLRNWNQRNPTRSITVACTDIEQGLAYPLRQVFDPYFKALGQDSLLPKVRRAGSITPEIRSWMDSVIRTAREKTVPKEASWLTKKFIGQVWKNVQSTIEASEAGDKGSYEDFLRLRVAAITDHLTNPAFFGEQIEKGKSILWVGANHAKTRLVDSSAMKMEGWVLATQFAPTKGKVFSIRVAGFAYSVPQQYFHGNAYQKGGEGFQSLVNIYKQDTPEFVPNRYRILDTLTKFSSSLTAQATRMGASALLLRADALNRAAFRNNGLKKDPAWMEMAAHDAVLVMPVATLFSYE